MSIDAMNDVWEHSEATGSARVVMLCLANYADANSVAWPSVALLAKRARITPRNVRKHIDALVEAGEITPVGTGIRGVVKYQITCATPVEIDTGDSSDFDTPPLSESTEDTPVENDTCRNRHPCRERHPTPVGTDLGSPVGIDTQTLTKPSLNQKQGGEKRGKRLDVDALPDTWRDWAIGQGHMNPAREWLKFSNYWTSKTGSGATKLDWFKTWQNWILKSLEGRASNGRTYTQPQGFQSRDDVFRKMEREAQLRNSVQGAGTVIDQGGEVVQCQG